MDRSQNRLSETVLAEWEELQEGPLVEVIEDPKLKKTISPTVRLILFLLYALMTGLSPIFNELILYDPVTQSKNVTFIPQLPYLFGYVMCCVICLIMALFRLGWSKALTECFNIKGILYYYPIVLFHGLSDSLELLTMRWLDGPFRAILNQLRLPGYSAARRILFKAKQTAVQWVLIGAITVSVIAYSTARIQAAEEGAALKLIKSQPALESLNITSGVAVVEPTVIPEASVLKHDDIIYNKPQDVTSNAPQDVTSLYNHNLLRHNKFIENNKNLYPNEAETDYADELDDSSANSDSSDDFTEQPNSFLEIERQALLSDRQKRMLGGAALATFVVGLGMTSGLFAEHRFQNKQVPLMVLSVRLRIGTVCWLTCTAIIYSYFTNGFWKLYTLYNVSWKLLLLSLWIALRDLVVIGNLAKSTTSAVALSHVCALVVTYVAETAVFRKPLLLLPSILLVLIIFLLLAVALYKREKLKEEASVAK